MIRHASSWPTEKDISAAFESARKEIRYIVTDYPVELIVSKYKDDKPLEGDIYIPEYQRSLRWTDEGMSYFIESVLLRIPIPPIFLYEVDGRLEIVDGSQRVRTLVKFAKSEFELIDLNKLDILNGFRFSDLPPSMQKRLMNTSIRSFVLDEGTDTSTRVEMFRRLNTTGKKLHDAEIRKGAYQGSFLELILDCAESDVFTSLTPRISRAFDPKSERQELVSRFFIYSDYYAEFTHDVQKFLDNHIMMGNKAYSLDELNQRRMEFAKTMRFISNSDPDVFYRKARSATLPKLRFEALAVGACLALRKKPKMRRADFSFAYQDEFNDLVRTDASNSGPRLRARIEYVRNCLLEH